MSSLQTATTNQLPCEANNLLVLCGLLVLALWILRVGKEALKIAAFQSAFHENIVVRMDGVGASLGAVGMVHTLHLKHLLRSFHPNPIPLPVNKYMVPFVLHKSTLKSVWTNIQNISLPSVEFEFDCQVPCCIQTFWGLRLNVEAGTGWILRATEIGGEITFEQNSNCDHSVWDCKPNQHFVQTENAPNPSPPSILDSPPPSPPTTTTTTTTNISNISNINKTTHTNNHDFHNSSKMNENEMGPIFHPTVHFTTSLCSFFPQNSKITKTARNENENENCGKNDNNNHHHNNDNETAQNEMKNTRLYTARANSTNFPPLTSNNNHNNNKNNNNENNNVNTQQQQQQQQRQPFSWNFSRMRNTTPPSLPTPPSSSRSSSASVAVLNETENNGNFSNEGVVLPLVVVVWFPGQHCSRDGMTPNVSCQIFCIEFEIAEGLDLQSSGSQNTNSPPRATIAKTFVVTPENVYDVQEVFGKTKDEDCVVCLSEPKSAILMPCRHFCVCDGCLDMLDKCPICRADFAGFLKRRDVVGGGADDGGDGDGEDDVGGGVQDGGVL